MERNQTKTQNFVLSCTMLAHSCINQNEYHLLRKGIKSWQHKSLTEVHKCIGKVLQCPIRTAPGFFYSVNDSYPRLFAYEEFHC